MKTMLAIAMVTMAAQVCMAEEPTQQQVMAAIQGANNAKAEMQGYKMAALQAKSLVLQSGGNQQAGMANWAAGVSFQEDGDFFYADITKQLAAGKLQAAYNDAWAAIISYNHATEKYYAALQDWNNLLQPQFRIYMPAP